MKKSLKVIALIPARMGSSRFPGKPLEKILGLPMIEHVRRRVEKMGLIDETYVATCDPEIFDVVVSNGGKAIMTADTHERCTDRIEEAARGLTSDVIINVQGDEPMVSSVAIEEVLAPFFQIEGLKTSCLVYPITDFSELNSENIVKVVLSRGNNILYLSRSRIPGKDVDNDVKYYKQSGIMAFAKDFLHEFHNLESTPLEQKESVDMLRVLEHDFSIQGVVSTNETKGVDIPEQISMIEELIMSDPKQKEIFERIVKS
ncbi:MAG: 3-deoxy-manno-octulosonate cytidylyltransferase [Bdellovibrionales bacterium]|nr:3-deoxy-manno-octulosonate cytidylyltransferase [Bdellovibrionales bacterium]